MKFKDYYQVLGVGREASAEEIKRAYRRLARKYHPDVSSEPQAEDRFKEVQEAYEVLRDPEKRGAYDQVGRGFRAGQEFRPPPGWAAGFNFAGPGLAGGFSEFFEQLFGAASPFGAPPAGAGFSRRGGDHRARIELTLEQAHAGGAHPLEVHVPGAGAAAPRSHRLNVKLPRGVTDGQVVRLAGQGSPGTGRGRRGDLYLEVSLRRHPLFAVEGRDLTLTLPIAPWEAALGATVTVPTLDGPVDLHVPPGSRAGQKLRLKGRGLGGGTGADQYVLLQIVLPPADSPRARELYEAMRRDLPFDPRPGLHGFGTR